jgi:lipopolysaccharide/colanic/teichoic acid biosynthesis glycosyltransferase
MRKTVILGTGPLGRRIFTTLVNSPKLGLDPVAFVGAFGPIEGPVIFESSYHRKRDARVLPGPVTPNLLRRLNASVLIIAEPELEAQELADIRQVAEAARMFLYVVPEPFVEDGSTTEYVELDGLMLAYKAPPDARPLYDAAKRALDVGISALGLLLVSPVLAAAALAVKLDSWGPVIFRQRRVGHNGRLFDIYKFRTMYAECSRYACSPTNGKDPRITWVGRFLRHTCIDELPQLVNVLRGEMSLVGPRPEMPFIVEQYEAIHRKRLAIKPGITGLWQLSADRMSPIHHNLSYDFYYTRHRNFLMDIAILLHTVLFAFRGV